MNTQLSDQGAVDTAYETRFSMDTSGIKFGPGVTCEIGEDVRGLGAKRVLVVTDQRLAGLEPVATVCDSLREAGIEAEVYDGTRVEPT
ncbi:MAG: iron-containing alcohol dehydrogenase, partial [Chloroflexota bacterium]|nr:iron-containing alcohol dehydrogenase [Chloroflexota bacterium]